MKEMIAELKGCLKALRIVYGKRFGRNCIEYSSMTKEADDGKVYYDAEIIVHGLTDEAFDVHICTDEEEFFVGLGACSVHGTVEDIARFVISTFEWDSDREADASS